MNASTQWEIRPRCPKGGGPGAELLHPSRLSATLGPHVEERTLHLVHHPKALVPSPAASLTDIQGQDPLPQFQDPPPFSVPKVCKFSCPHSHTQHPIPLQQHPCPHYRTHCSHCSSSLTHHGVATAASEGALSRWCLTNLELCYPTQHRLGSLNFCSSFRGLPRQR